jgi:hypothetical protein
MEFVRQVVNSNVLDKITLPQSLRNRRVEIIILPIDNNNHGFEQEKTIDDIVGILAAFKNPDLMPIEKNAWAGAMEDKHGNR